MNTLSGRGTRRAAFIAATAFLMVSSFSTISVAQVMQGPVPVGAEVWSTTDNCAYNWNGAYWQKGAVCRLFPFGTALVFDTYLAADPQRFLVNRIDLQRPGWAYVYHWNHNIWFAYERSNPNEPYRIAETSDLYRTFVFYGNQWLTVAQVQANSQGQPASIPPTGALKQELPAPTPVASPTTTTDPTNLAVLAAYEAAKIDIARIWTRPNCTSSYNGCR